MTPEEHELMLLVLARVYQGIGAIGEVMKSRGVWTSDDEKAFFHLAHYDEALQKRWLLQAQKDYCRLAIETGALKPGDALPFCPPEPQTRKPEGG